MTQEIVHRLAAEFAIAEQEKELRDHMEGMTGEGAERFFRSTMQTSFSAVMDEQCSKEEWLNYLSRLTAMAKFMFIAGEMEKGDKNNG